MEKKFYEDIMLQNFSFGTFYNPTRYIMLCAMMQSGKFNNVYNISDIVNYVYLVYCKNQKLSIHHPKIEIRSIPYYGISAIHKDVIDSLNDWVHDAKHNVLSYDFKNIYLNLDDDGHICLYVKKILGVLFLKKFNLKINQMNLFDLDLDAECIKYMAFADMQYCVICDECNSTKLTPVHIYNNNDCSALYDSSNLLLMCKRHANEYNQGEFYFDERGRVVSSDNSLKNTRLPSKIYLKRKKYIIEKLKNNNA